MRRRRGGSAPEVSPNRGDSAYESGRRATKPGSHLWGASSRGNLPSEEASNDPPENEVEDYGLVSITFNFQIENTIQIGINKLFLGRVVLENRSSLIIGEPLASDYDSEMIRCPLPL